MSKYLALGMTLEQVVTCVTRNPAKLLGMEGKIGTLAPGAFADIAVMKLCRKEQEYWDSTKNPSTAVRADAVLVPQATLLNGVAVYRANDF